MNSRLNQALEKLASMQSPGVVSILKKRGFAFEAGVVGEVLAAFAAAKVAPAPRVFIELDGGLVQQIVSEIEINAFTVDVDCEGADFDEITVVPIREGVPPMDAVVGGPEVVVSLDRVEEIAAAVVAAEDQPELPPVSIVKVVAELPIEEPKEGDEPLTFRNYYRCPGCGHEWDDVWDGQPDDDCPNCGKRHISPYTSEDAE